MFQDGSDGRRGSAGGVGRQSLPTSTPRRLWALQFAAEAATQTPTAAGRPLPCVQFHALFAPFPRFFSSFPHGTCSLSVSCPYLALGGTYHPLWAAFPSNPTRSGRMLRARPPTGLSPSAAARSRAPGGRCAAARLVYNSPARFQNRAGPASLAATAGIPVGFFSSAY